MDFIEKLFNFFELAANGVKDIEFLKYFFPIISIIGGATLLYYGFRGVFLKSTINLMKFRGLSFSQSVNSVGTIVGTSAVIIGFFYIVIGLFLLTLLGGISYYIWF